MNCKSVIRGRIWIPMATLALICSAGAFGILEPTSAATTTIWHAIVGRQSGDRAVQATAFLPNNLTVDAGDSVTWSFPTDEVHTVTFSFANSGTLKGGQTFSQVFNTPGDFTFKCLIHKHMTGTVHVQAAGTPYPHDQQFYDREGQDQGQDLVQAGLKDIAQQRADTVRDRDDVTIGSAHADDVVTIPGGGEQSYLIARFLPDHRDVKVGQAITWTTSDFATPHTVTFGSPPSPPTNPNPIGLGGPGEQTTLSAPYPQLGSGPTVSSGFLGDFSGTQGTTFTVTFNAPGTYLYYCELHRDLGMTGTVTVH